MHALSIRFNVRELLEEEHVGGHLYEKEKNK